MRTHLLYLLSAVLLLMLSFEAFSQTNNPGKMPRKQRTEYLIEQSRDVMQTCGHEWYAMYLSRPEKPVVSKAKKFQTDDKRPEISAHIGREYYEVTFPCSLKKDKSDWTFAAKVELWKDTGEPFEVFFGHNQGFNFFFESYQSYKQSGNMIQIQYEPFPVIPSIW